MEVNYGQGETECMPMFYGPDCEKISRTVSTVVISGLELVPRVGSPFGLRIVSQYKHLGVVKHARVHFGPEVSARVNAMSGALADNRALLRSCRVHVECKTNVVQSVATSRLFWNACIGSPS